MAIVPNGIDIPELTRKEVRSFKTLLFLGRIDPVKGIDVMLNAWARVMDRFADWRLLIVGSDASYGKQHGYLDQMKALAARLNLERVEFAEPLYGESKWGAYRQADLFVLPTRSENFGITVAEALAASTPAIVTKGAPWQGLPTRGAGWWIDFGVDALAACFGEAMAESPDRLASRGVNGRDWMMREFSWHGIGLKIDRTYKWLVEGGVRPPWVNTN